MARYLLRRLLAAVAVCLGVVLVTFVLSRLVPGGEARAALGARASSGTIAAFNRLNGFDLPIDDQLWRYVEGLVVHFDLGYSYKANQPVRDLIFARLPKTLVLVGLSTALAVLVAVPLGVLQVARRNRPLDYVLTGGSFVLYAMPSFLLGELLILYFAIDLHWFSPEAPSATTVAGILADPRGWILPVVTLAAITIASFSRYVRSSMMEAMAQDFVRTARAKGASSRRVLVRHALPNALIPLITLLGLSLPSIASGALITETVFNYPGMGLLTATAAFSDDVPLLLGTTLLVSIVTVAGSLLADVSYAIVDPRVRYV